MYKPSHPGSILREDVLPALGLTVTEAANQIGVSRVALSRVINEKAGSSAEMWVGMQMKYDMWQVRQNRKMLPKLDS